MLDYIMQMVEKFGNSNDDDDWYFLIPSKEADGVKRGLREYVEKQNGDWLYYDIQPLMNDIGWILRLSA